MPTWAYDQYAEQMCEVRQNTVGPLGNMMFMCVSESRQCCQNSLRIQRSEQAVADRIRKCCTLDSMVRTLVWCSICLKSSPTMWLKSRTTTLAFSNNSTKSCPISIRQKVIGIETPLYVVWIHDMIWFDINPHSTAVRLALSQNVTLKEVCRQLQPAVISMTTKAYANWRDV